MRTRSLLLYSATLNLLLAGALAWSKALGLGAHGAKHLPEGFSTTPNSAAASAQNVAHAVFNWSQLESTNYQVYIANLRRIGCPEETVEDLIAAEITKLYAPRIAAAQRRPAVHGRYWQRQPPWSPQAYSEQKELLRERNALLKTLLGIDFDEYNRRANPSAEDEDDAFSPLAFLPQEKQKALQALQEKYRVLEARIYSDAHGLITAHERSAISVLHQQESTEMNALLTPDERFEYDVRNSPSATRLQQGLEAFQPSEQEFRSIYQAQSAFEEKLQTTQEEVSSGSHVQPEEELTSQLKAALGEERYAEYERSKQPAYQMLARIAERYGLTKEVATQVFDLQQNVQNESSQVMRSTQLTDDQKRDWLQSARDQTSAAVSHLLGEQGFAAYHDYGGGWIDRLGK